MNLSPLEASHKYGDKSELGNHPANCRELPSRRWLRVTRRFRRLRVRRVSGRTRLRRLRHRAHPVESRNGRNESQQVRQPVPQCIRRYSEVGVELSRGTLRPVHDVGDGLERDERDAEPLRDRGDGGGLHLLHDCPLGPEELQVPGAAVERVAGRDHAELDGRPSCEGGDGGRGSKVAEAVLLVRVPPEVLWNATRVEYALGREVDVPGPRTELAEPTRRTCRYHEVRTEGFNGGVARDAGRDRPDAVGAEPTVAAAPDGDRIDGAVRHFAPVGHHRSAGRKGARLHWSEAMIAHERHELLLHGVDNDDTSHDLS
mmetsp:Transcript_2336/g.6166  ORF Transcript_2336/g.6166 Transcript_2336/m.6166 type:complete len:315 (-) Transcript_2336:22-966(-)